MSSETTGYKSIGTGNWYGSGYCGICGSKQVIPRSCRWWDPDDGWKFGVLCSYCTDDAKARPPRATDFACQTADDDLDSATRIDIAAELMGDDEDGVLASLED